ncbi:hypothetical protein KKA13_03470 [Patescibacteria group bacterium]|nr:hypothetical protein [Patescibacteria group bacterium]MBU1612845.1 hypothetical protein [Patescibacteria group bacterium]
MKKIFQKLIISFIIISAFSISPANFVFADSFGLDATQKATGEAIPATIQGSKTVVELVGAIVSTLLGFIGIVFFIIILYAGFRWMFAMGNTEATTKAKDMLEASVIGLIIVVSAYAVAKFVFSGLTG